MFEKFGEFDSCEEINRAAKAQLEEGDLEAIRTIAEENGLDPEDAEDFCTGAIEELTTPFPPNVTLVLFLFKFTFTPGATLKLFLNLNPINLPSFVCLPIRNTTILIGTYSIDI